MSEKISFWSAPKAPSGRVKAIWSADKTTMTLYDSESGKFFASFPTSSTTTTTILAGMIRNASGNTEQYQQQQQAQVASTAGYKPGTAAYVAMMSGRFTHLQLANKIITVNEKGQVVVMDKQSSEAGFSSLGNSKDYIVIDPQSGQVVDQGQQFDEQLVWNPVSQSLIRASELPGVIEKARDEFFAKQDAEKGLLPGTSKGMSNFIDGLVKVGDVIVKVGGFIGVPGPLLDIYKAFAPPGSEYYKEGTMEDKFKDLMDDPTFWTGIVTGQLSKDIKAFRATTNFGDGEKVVDAAEWLLTKAPMIIAKISEEPGDTAQDKVVSFLNSKLDPAKMVIDILTGGDSPAVDVASVSDPYREVGTTTQTAPTGETEESTSTEEPEVAVSTGEIKQETPLVATDPGIVLKGIVENVGKQELRNFRNQGNKFSGRIGGGAFGKSVRTR